MHRATVAIQVLGLIPLLVPLGLRHRIRPISPQMLEKLFIPLHDVIRGLRAAICMTPIRSIFEKSIRMVFPTI
ncbi:hypothetical protein BDQ17DRAFT_1371040 [Cyathus striatus]|nr:hypothetical protein BDQ17DRAFT_1371040 [Cyathus striatus]